MATASLDGSTSLDTATDSVETNIMYDLRMSGDRRSASTSQGTTILPSVAPSSLTNSFPADDARVGADQAPAESSALLSLNPSMIDSSVILPSEASDASGNWIGFHRPASLSQSSISSCDISSCDTTSTSRTASSYHPDLFVNIGRSLLLASAYSDADVTEKHGDKLSGQCDVPGSGRVNWWERLRTDEDWDKFRVRANEHLNALVAEELKNTKRKESVGYEYSVDKTRAISKGTAEKTSQGMPKLMLWLQGLYEAITLTTAGIVSGETSGRHEYLSSLVKDVADIQQQLERLPPIPPTFPEELPLDDFPGESRESLKQYRDRLITWRGEAMPQRQELAAKYVQCQERLLAAIIDTEEELFYGYEGKGKLQNHGRTRALDNEEECNILGAVNDDGYIEVVGKKSPMWDDVYEAGAASQSKCHLTLRAALFAALTAGAGILLTLQSKRK
ncbi:hypothetical protein ACHAWF_016615 [Thalassiosira exigua]